ncbi:unnamed protein product [Protopolystoma xenopodis]|uniref:Uncharacterized protein n=1 Tax=Protopolystoma xenopodis TaxID=117903 RepID=A0A448XSU7_9PLAT|nr:unnamed protein product [Protopolystoma xenopodis]
MGVKIVNLVTNRAVRHLGSPENLRFVQLALIPPHASISNLAAAGFDASSSLANAVPSLEMVAAMVAGTAVGATSESTSSGSGGTSADGICEADEDPMKTPTITIDPVLVCSAFKKNRIYLFTNREPHDIKAEYVISLK